MYHKRLLLCGSSFYARNSRSPIWICSCCTSTFTSTPSFRSLPRLSFHGKASTATKAEPAEKDTTASGDVVSRRPRKPSAKYRRTISNQNVHQTDELSGLGATSLRDTNISLFIRNSRELIELDLSKAKGQKVTVLRPNTEGKKQIHINLADVFGVNEQDVMFRENQPPPIESVDEVKWKEQKLQLDQLLGYYLKLSKIRLTTLIVVTTMGGYFLAPGPFDLGTLLLVTAGTGLMSGAANAMNQFFEIPYDSQMNRTKNRVLVRGHISNLHAVTFAALAGSSGLGILFMGVNPVTAALGCFNLGLYALVYTPMKRLSVANTWIGAFVGSIPPMMGWAAATGSLDIGAFWLGALLYSWQFPHFNALSWNLRADYSRAGYRMMSVVNPELCKRVALRHCAFITGLCFLGPIIDVTTATFVIASTPLNLFQTYLGWKFYKEGDSKSSRMLFRFTLIHIPLLMALMLITKKSPVDSKKEEVMEGQLQLHPNTEVAL